MMLDDAPQSIQALEQRLLAEGCNSANYAIGDRGSASDAYCLTWSGSLWQVFYTERGVDQAPFFSSPSEGEACAFFFRQIMSMRHDHCVGFFRSAAAADAFERLLAANGISCWRDQIRYSGPHDPRYRVFVVGRAIFSVRELRGDLPARG